MGAYGFQFKDGPSTPFAEIVYVGWEKRNGNYHWDGLHRATSNQCIFQYTLAGRGEIRIGTQTYPLEPNSAFLVVTGTDHRYYLPQDSELWEFIFITLMGPEALACWSAVHNHSGPIVRFAPDSPVIRTLEHIFLEASKKSITNGYKASGLAAQFVMEVYQSLKYNQASPDTWPEVVVTALKLIHENYAAINSIEELCRSLGISKYKFSRLFHTTCGMTAMQYLTKTRMEKAMELLRRTKLNLGEIARLTGYSDENYFNKVFRKSTGIAPGRFRSSKQTIRVDHISFN
ncbi:HTH-type transcriptional regulator YesS [Paenibacillus konkukensis]|uniref:HTH-type transcriptional regulator YesS n=1 Tax=Paenibacillus konkukensis TaxID=2020716 RepID=A0ABY4RR43_9BACL|nr:AraC family transcriptional regulator [Paenibacillus konkukensis]UQZ84251.1 HTH-type transcriptional regulator YesS [Paenibacillus konkukensis]